MSTLASAVVSRSIIRNNGAFFIRRRLDNGEERKDTLYRGILQEVSDFSRVSFLETKRALYLLEVYQQRQDATLLSCLFCSE